jgi:Fur family peroxide stress response transcriptional regulator
MVQVSIDQEQRETKQTITPKQSSRLTFERNEIMSRKSKSNDKVALAVQKLKSIGLRATPQRVAILAFLEGNTSHPSAEQIYEALKPDMPSLSLGTVYNTLDELLQRGQLQALAISPTRKHVDANPEPHYHFLCEVCGNIYDYPGELQTENASEETKGFKVEKYAVYLYGTCPSCNEVGANQSTGWCAS